MYVCIHVYVCMCMCTYIYIYRMVPATTRVNRASILRDPGRAARAALREILPRAAAQGIIDIMYSVVYHMIYAYIIYIYIYMYIHMYIYIYNHNINGPDSSVVRAYGLGSGRPWVRSSPP